MVSLLIIRCSNYSKHIPCSSYVNSQHYLPDEVEERDSSSSAEMILVEDLLELIVELEGDIERYPDSIDCVDTTSNIYSH